MSEVGIDISKHIPTNVTAYLSDTWDYVITVCGSANETCPAFEGNVGKRLHIGFDDPSEAIGTTDFIRSEFERVRNEIKNEFAKFSCRAFIITLPSTLINAFLSITLHMK